MSPAFVSFHRCAGVCSYEGRGGLCSIRLSEPLLKLRPRKDLVEVRWMVTPVPIAPETYLCLNSNQNFLINVLLLDYI